MNKLLKNVYWLMEVSASSVDSFVRSQYLADVIMNFWRSSNSRGAGRSQIEY